MTTPDAYTIGPSQPEVRELSIGEALREAAEEVPDQVALINGVPDITKRREWTYAQLYRESLRVAKAIRKRFEPGERLAIWAPNSPEWILTEFGCALAGVILVTVNPSYRPHEVAYVLKQSRSSGIIVLPEFRGNRMLLAVDEIKGECPDLREIIRFDQWQDFLESGDDCELELPDVKPGDAVMIQYTSGTTGFPKGALLHHRGLVNNGAHTMDRMGVTENSVWLTMMPLFHTGGCVLCVLGCISKRATQVLVESFDPGLVLELIETYSVAGTSGVPTMLISLLEHPDFADTELSTVKTITSGGSTVPAPLVQRFEAELGAAFTIVFGQTECSPVASMTRPDDSLEDKATTLGGAMPNVEIKIVDPETGVTVPQGTLGEYCTRGYHVMNGYFDMPEATAAAIDSEGWLHTGDLCSMDQRGYCTVEGRLKDMIIRGGENIYPRELEELLFQHPTVGEAAVVGLPDDKWGEVVGAFIRAAPGQAVDPEELLAYLRVRLSPQKTPSLWFLVDEFPLTGSGKIQKFKLREQWENGEFDQI